LTVKRYKELAARSRVPLGFVLLVVYAIFARPTWQYFAAGMVLAIAGLLLRAWATGHLDKNRDLCIGGPYSHTRNPLYLGTALAGMGFALAGGVWWIALLFLVVLLAVYLPVVIEEESHLRNLFPSFADYAMRVPRFLPSLTARVQSTARFRMALYRQNQEYNALVGFCGMLALLLWKLVRA
jgi:protein-S-isoprenylcysteine O-methyltransferase Ste14